MCYLALVTDYDGTIAIKGRASEAALHTIARLRASGRRDHVVADPARERKHSSENRRQSLLSVWQPLVWNRSRSDGWSSRRACRIRLQYSRQSRIRD